MDTKISLLEKIDILLASFNEDIYLNNIVCKEGTLISISPKDKCVAYVNIWKIKYIVLGALSNYALAMIADRLEDVYNKRGQGFLN